MSRRRATEISASGGGCVSTIIGILVIWALLFGVTIDGKHYGLSGCSQERGVEIDK